MKKNKTGSAILYPVRLATLHVSESMSQMIRAEAQRQNKTISEILRIAIATYINTKLA